MPVRIRSLPRLDRADPGPSKDVKIAEWTRPEHFSSPAAVKRHAPVRLRSHLRLAESVAVSAVLYAGHHSHSGRGLEFHPIPANERWSMPGLRVFIRQPALRIFILSPVLFVATIVSASDLTALLSRAQRLMAQEEFGGAIDLLERHATNAARPPEYQALLRQAYRARARQLVLRGQSDAAQPFLVRLRNLEGVTTPAPLTPAPAAISRPGSAETPRARGTREPVAAPARWTPIARMETGAARSQSVVRPSTSPASSPVAVAARSAQVTAMSSVADLARADKAFQESKYAEAERLYRQSFIAGADLSADARARWGYCRMVGVVDAINRLPAGPQEWAEVEREVQSIVELVPGNEYAQFLVGVVADRRRRFGGVVSPIVRASEPEETPTASRATESGQRPTTKWPSRAAGSDDRREAGRNAATILSRSNVGRWSVVETANFRIFGIGDRLLLDAARIAEQTRANLFRTWFGDAKPVRWQPLCELYLHDDDAEYSRLTNLGASSPGNSSVAVERGRVRSRRIDLRSDAASLLEAVLPHEITHVVMSDRFTEPALPRWADEGLAVLTEPDEKMAAHLRNLVEWRSRGRHFTAQQLMTMHNYPPGELWGLFYAESVSLVDFLVQRGGPARFIEFLSAAISRGYEPELHRVYGIRSFSELDALRLVHEPEPQQ